MLLCCDAHLKTWLQTLKVYDRLLAAGLKLKAKKCLLFCQKVVYFGHVISEEGIATDPEKTKIVESWPVPTNVKELRSFMGFCGYYRKFPSISQMLLELF
jgi:hypothetical protein